MTKISEVVVITSLMTCLVLPAQAKSRHEMCEITEMAIQTISQKLGDPVELTAQKRNAVHNQCFTAPLTEIKETYNYLIQNWDTIFDNLGTK